MTLFIIDYYEKKKQEVVVSWKSRKLSMLGATDRAAQERLVCEELWVGELVALSVPSSADFSSKLPLSMESKSYLQNISTLHRVQKSTSQNCLHLINNLCKCAKLYLSHIIPNIRFLISISQLFINCQRMIKNKEMQNNRLRWIKCYFICC